MNIKLLEETLEKLRESKRNLHKSRREGVKSAIELVGKAFEMILADAEHGEDKLEQALEIALLMAKQLDEANKKIIELKRKNG